MTKNIIVTGVGGQGSILTSHVIAEAAIASGRQKIKVGETYGAAMRGGKVISHIRLDNAYAPLIEEDNAELIIALEPLEGLRSGVEYISPKGNIVLSDAPVPPIDTNIGYAKYPKLEDILSALRKLCQSIIAIPARKLALEVGTVKVLNTVMLGVSSGLDLLEIDNDIILKTLVEWVNPSMADINRKAFVAGYDYGRKLKMT